MKDYNSLYGELRKKIQDCKKIRVDVEAREKKKYLDLEERYEDLLKVLPDKMQCKICRSNPYEVSLVPCGHLVCKDCAGR